MRELIKKIEIATSSKNIWAVMSDVERWHEWTPSITRIQLTDFLPLHLGSHAVIKQPKFPAAKWEVTEFVPGKSFTWQSHGPGILVSASHQIEAITADEVCTVRLRLGFSGVLGGLFASLTAGINERYLNFEMEGLQKRCKPKSVHK